MAHVTRSKLGTKVEYHSKEEDAEHGKRRLKVCDSLPSPPSLPFLPTLSHAMQAMKMMKNDKRFRVPLIDGLKAILQVAMLSV